MSGVQMIREQASYITNALFDQAKHRFGCINKRGNSKQSGGEIFYLRNLFERVQRGQLTPDQAVAEAQGRWGQEAENSPELLKDLATSLAKAPRHPEQLPMSDEFWGPCGDIRAPIPQPKPKPSRGPELPVPQHYRIEIFRSRKGGDKKIKLTKIK